MTVRLSRRRFLASSTAAATGVMHAAGPRLVFGQGGAPQERDILLVVFLRGGADTLNLVVPFNDPNYVAARPNIAIDTPGQEGGALDLNGQFGFHPNASGLHGLYSQGDLAIINAVGVMDQTRSHFDAQDYLEKGIPSKSENTGWMKRHLDMVGTPAVIRGMSVGSQNSIAFAGDPSAIAMSDVDSFIYDGPWREEDQMRLAVRRMYMGNTWLEEVANQALDTSDIIEAAGVDDYVPENGAVYPNTGFADDLELVAQVIKLDLGLQIANIDLGGGWDTHENQNGTFNTLVGRLSGGLEAFWTDMAAHRDRLTVCVVTEFGRRLRENGNAGSDHGHAWSMMVLSGNVQGGQIYGTWPGLATEQLDRRVDLAITTDYRSVLAEILMQRVGNTAVDYVFPGVQMANGGSGLGLFGALPQFGPTGLVLR